MSWVSRDFLIGSAIMFLIVGKTIDSRMQTNLNNSSLLLTYQKNLSYRQAHPRLNHPDPRVSKLMSVDSPFNYAVALRQSWNEELMIEVLKKYGSKCGALSRKRREI